MRGSKEAETPENSSRPTHLSFSRAFHQTLMTLVAKAKSRTEQQARVKAKRSTKKRKQTAQAARLAAQAIEIEETDVQAQVKARLASAAAASANARSTAVTKTKDVKPNRFRVGWFLFRTAEFFSGGGNGGFMSQEGENLGFFNLFVKFVHGKKGGA